MNTFCHALEHVRHIVNIGSTAVAFIHCDVRDAQLEGRLVVYGKDMNKNLVLACVDRHLHDLRFKSQK